MMDNCDEFEWIEFNELANSYLQEDSEAKKKNWNKQILLWNILYCSRFH